MSDDRRKSDDWPMSGPVDDTVDEVTDRFTLLDSTPAIQAAFLRLDRRLSELDRIISARIHASEQRAADQRSDDLGSIRDELLNAAADVRARDHTVRDDAAAALAEVSVSVQNLRSDLVEHELADAKVHTDIRGESGKNGKIGRLEERQAATDRRIKWAAGIVVSILLAAAGGAWAALEKMNERAREAGREDERERQLERRLDRVEGYLLGSGLINSTPGDTL